ncbi:hypothetical protein OG762_03300 [Streptomyces sp. NBC_01136]|uniref:hypothetical protein n=1 Tax=unclassified Streptomyces TaxID=2593676 RepID=UPI003244C940|nr:hypothetical protein OG762_03300 [Streptomyces sp. NBC_01136]
MTSTATESAALGVAPATTGPGGQLAPAAAERAPGTDFGAAGSAARSASAATQTPASPQWGVRITSVAPRTAARQIPNIPRRAAA